MILGAKNILCLFILMIVMGCEDDKSSAVKQETQEQIEARTISEEDIEQIEYLEFGLSQDSKVAVEDWQKYNELSKQITFLKNADLSFFTSESELIRTFTREFRAEMPKELKTKEILARITALDTKIQKLNSQLRLSTSSKQEKLKCIEELLIAFRNLKLQINKKFEFEKNNILRPANTV